MKATLLLLLLAMGCNDYGLRGLEEDEPPPRPEPTPPATTLSCDELDLVLEWSASTPFSAADDPTDAAGLPFWHPDFDDASFDPIDVPDIGGVPQGSDRAYRATFDLDGPLDQLSVGFDSDDGLRVWLNGELLGRWGGDWQQEGCVNGAAGCTDTESVPPIPVEDLLVEGANVLAARVSNPLLDSWFDAGTSCE